MWKYQNTDELYHYGVLGMKWGHRKQLPMSSIANNIQMAKRNRMLAKAKYKKDFNYAYDHNNPYGIFTNNEQRWNRAAKSSKEYEDARNEYKKAKQIRKDAINNKYHEIKKNASFGDRLMFSSGTFKRASQYVVDHDMKISDATKMAKKDAARNTGIAMAAIGGLTMAALYAKRRR